MSNKYEALDAYIASLGLTYEAKFYPQHQTRSRDDKHPSLNWEIKLSKFNLVLETDYMQGIAHMPKYYQGPFKSNYERHQHDQYCWKVAQTGKSWGRRKQDPQGNKTDEIVYVKWSLNVTESFAGHPWHDVPKPELRDVLWCLTIDADVLDCGGFKGWAENFGYSDDSIKAKKTYDECIANSLKLRAMIGQDGIDKLKQLYDEAGF